MLNKILLKIGWKRRDYFGDIYWDTTEILFDITITLFLVWIGMTIKAL
jgi:hypothetical protein